MIKNWSVFLTALFICEKKVLEISFCSVNLDGELKKQQGMSGFSILWNFFLITAWYYGSYCYYVLGFHRLSHNQVARSNQHTPGNMPKPCSAASLGVGLVFFPLGDAERYVPLVFFSSHSNEIQTEWWLFYQKRISVELTSFCFPGQNIQKSAKVWVFDGFSHEK